LFIIVLHILIMCLSAWFKQIGLDWIMWSIISSIFGESLYTEIYQSIN